MAVVIDTECRTDVARGERAMSIALPASATDGVLSILDVTVPPGQPGPPRHRHPASDETFLVLEGVLLLDTVEGLRRIEAGGIAFVPRGEPHTFATPLDSGARFVGVHTPGGFEAFHVAADRERQLRGHVLSREELAELAAAFDWVGEGPPLDPRSVSRD